MIVPVTAVVITVLSVVTVKAITRVKSHETLIVTSSGNIDKTLESGLNFVSPLSETHKIDGRKRRVNIPEVGTIGSDGESILMDGFYVIMSVSDARKVFNMDSSVESKVSYEIQNILKQVSNNMPIEEIDAEGIASEAESRLKRKEDELGIEVNAVKPGKVRKD